MKRTLKWLLGILFTCILVFGLVACEEDSSSSSAGIESDIAFKTLQVDGTEVYGKVSNSMETFSFLNEVTESNNAKYIVSLDIYGIQKVATKTIPLFVGDNTVYITEIMNDEPINVYTIIIRRRPMYEVTFKTNGGTAVESQIVEEDGFATQPETARAGYTFKGWNYDFTQPIIGNTTVSASWTAHTDIPYKVEYYLQNLENDNYTLKTTENKIGVTDTTVSAEIKTFAHFTPIKNSVAGNIHGDGSLVLKVYYRRNQYTVAFDGNGGTLISGKKTQTVKYGGSVTAPTYTREGYTFTGFDKTNYTNISESFTVTAGWQINQYTLTIVYNNGQDDAVITQDYNTLISVENPTRNGYGFTGWDKTIPTRMPAKNQTITAQWSAIYELSGNTITGLTAYGEVNYTELNIPSSIDGVAVKKIGAEAFGSYISLTSVTIPDSVTAIGSDAFSNCSKLASVTIPNSVTSIGDNAFSGCKSLTSVVIPDSVTTIEGGAFADCDGLTSVTLGNSVTIIEPLAFYNCDSLTSIELPDSVTTIGDSAFYYCDSLTSIELPDSVTTIGDSAFYYCGSLASIVIPNSVTTIGNSAFLGCSSLTSVVIPDSVTTIEGGAFSYCDGLTSVTIPDSVTTIEGGAFSYCDGLTSVTIPDSVTTIGNGAFENCSSLTSVVIPDSVTSVGNGAFAACSSLTSVTIGNSVTSIGYKAFYSCNSLTSISFKGTIAQLKAIIKGSYWIYNVPATKVICSNGWVTL